MPYVTGEPDRIRISELTIATRAIGVFVCIEYSLFRIYRLQKSGVTSSTESNMQICVSSDSLRLRVQYAVCSLIIDITPRATASILCFNVLEPQPHSDGFMVC